MRRIGSILGMLLGTCVAAQAADTASTEIRCDPPHSDTLDITIENCSAAIPLFTDRQAQAKAYLFRGRAYQEKGDLTHALPDYDEAVGVLSDNVSALQWRAEVNQGLSRVPEARADYQHLVQLQPNETRWRVALDKLGVSVPPPSPSVAQAQPQTAQPQPPTKPAQAVATAPAPPPSPLVTPIQIALRKLGYPISDGNGAFGPPTREAIDLFSADNGQPAGRAPDAQLLAALQGKVREQTALNQRAQVALRTLGLYRGTPDGDFGPRSSEALLQWSSAKGRPPSARVDQQLLAQLESDATAQQQAQAQQQLLAQQQAQAQQQALAQAQKSRASPAQAVAPTGPAAPTEQNVAQLPPADQSTPVAERTGRPEHPADVARTLTPQSGHEAPSTGATAGPDQNTAALTPQDTSPAAPAKPTPLFETKERRIALVIGNSKYQKVPTLFNPHNDAHDVAAALRLLNFEVIERYDVSRSDMPALVYDFGTKATGADLAFAYYSGHGLQVDGASYLMPVDAWIENRRDLQLLLPLNNLMENASLAKAAIVVIDACRDNPLADKLQTGGRTMKGLAPPQFDGSMLVAYATSSGAVASDGYGSNSPYTAALLSEIKTPGKPVSQLFDQIASDVFENTKDPNGRSQRPAVWNQLGTGVYLWPAAPEPVGVTLNDMTPAEVQAIQRSLSWLGYWSGKQDGKATSTLVDALKQWDDRSVADDGREQTIKPALIVQLHRRALAWDNPPAEPLPRYDPTGIWKRASSPSDIEAKRIIGMIWDPQFAGPRELQGSVGGDQLVRAGGGCGRQDRRGAAGAAAGGRSRQNGRAGRRSAQMAGGGGRCGRSASDASARPDAARRRPERSRSEAAGARFADQGGQ